MQPFRELLPGCKEVVKILLEFKAKEHLGPDKPADLGWSTTRTAASWRPGDAIQAKTRLTNKPVDLKEQNPSRNKERNKCGRKVEKVEEKKTP